MYTPHQIPLQRIPGAGAADLALLLPLIDALLRPFGRQLLLLQFIGQLVDAVLGRFAVAFLLSDRVRDVRGTGASTGGPCTPPQIRLHRGGLGG